MRESSVDAKAAMADLSRMEGDFAAARRALIAARLTLDSMPFDPSDSEFAQRRLIVLTVELNTARCAGQNREATALLALAAGLRSQTLAAFPTDSEIANEAQRLRWAEARSLSALGRREEARERYRSLAESTKDAIDVAAQMLHMQARLGLLVADAGEQRKAIATMGALQEVMSLMRSIDGDGLTRQFTEQVEWAQAYGSLRDVCRQLASQGSIARQCAGDYERKFTEARSRIAAVAPRVAARL